LPRRTASPTALSLWRGATIDPPKRSVPTFAEWWSWDLSFTGHAELRMEQRGVTEVEVRAMLERATGFEASVEGRFMITPNACKARGS